MQAISLPQTSHNTYNKYREPLFHFGCISTTVGIQCRLITAMGCRLNKPAASATVFNLSCIRVSNLTASADVSRTTTCCELLAEITAVGELLGG